MVGSANRSLLVLSVSSPPAALKYRNSLIRSNLVPEGRKAIAHGFKPWATRGDCEVPDGTEETSFVPSGTGPWGLDYPRLKTWAIVLHPSGTFEIPESRFWMDRSGRECENRRPNPDPPMNPETLKNPADYEAALARVEALMDAPPGSKLESELELWSRLVEDYEQQIFPVVVPGPGQASNKPSLIAFLSNEKPILPEVELDTCRSHTIESHRELSL